MYLKALFIGSIVVLLANPAFAESNCNAQTRAKHPSQQQQPPSVQKRVAHLAIDLNLDTSQQAQIIQILETHSAKRNAIHQKYQHQAMQEELKSLHQELNESMAQVMSADQLNTFEQLPKPKPRPHHPAQEDTEPTT